MEAVLNRGFVMCQASFPGSHCPASFPGSHCPASFPGSHCPASFPGSHYPASFPGSHCPASFPGSHCPASFPGSIADPCSQAPTAQPRSQAPTAQPRSQAPTAQPRSQAPTAQPRSQAPTAQPRSQAPTAQPRSQAPLWSFFFCMCEEHWVVYSTKGIRQCCVVNETRLCCVEMKLGVSGMRPPTNGLQANCHCSSSTATRHLSTCRDPPPLPGQLPRASCPPEEPGAERPALPPHLQAVRGRKLPQGHGDALYGNS